LKIWGDDNVANDQNLNLAEAETTDISGGSVEYGNWSENARLEFPKDVMGGFKYVLKIHFIARIVSYTKALRHWPYV
jgi:hypothetical protein